MRKQCRLLILLLFLIEQNGFAQTEYTAVMTLRQCIETGLKNNPDVRQRNLQMQSDELAWKQAKLNILPAFNGSAGHGINQGRSIDPFTNGYVNQRVNYASYSLSGSMILFSGFAQQNSIKQSAYNYQAAQMDYQQEMDNLTINIILAYLQVLSNEDQLALAINRVELTRKQVTRQEQLNAEGAIAPPVLYDIKGQLADDEISVINCQQILETSKLNLCQWLAIPYNQQLKLEKLAGASFAAIYADSPDRIYEGALTHFALVKSVELKKLGAEKGVKMSQAGLWPTLSLGADAYSNYSSAAMQSSFVNTTTVSSSDYIMFNGNTYPVMKQQQNFRTEKIAYGNQVKNNIASSIGLNLRIPLFNSLQARNKIKLAKIQLSSAELQESTAKIQLRQFIDQAYINMQAAFNKYKILLEQVELYKKSYDAAEIRFAAGVGTSIDYLTAKNNYERAMINQVTARYDYLLRTHVLDYYQGKQDW